MTRCMIFVGLLACGGTPEADEGGPGSSSGGEEMSPQPVTQAEAQPISAEAPEQPVGDSTPVAEEPARDSVNDASQPLPAEALAALTSLPNESIEAPDQFYYRSNERRHDLLVGPLANLGGAIIGVGADQCYTIAAMARSSLIVGVDYDNRIPLMHDLYQVLVPRSDTADALIARFEADREAETVALIEGAYEGVHARRVLRTFRRIREQMHVYLQRVKARTSGGQPGSWLADPALYAHIHQLFVNRRVLSRTGDLTGTTTLRSVGQTLTRLGIPVRIIYFSNAEQFFAYTPDFRVNMRELPTDEHSLVVRTIRHPEIANADNDRWHYIVQDFSDFSEKIETGVYGRSRLLLQDLVHAGAPHVGTGISHITSELPRWVLERRRSATRP